MLTLRGRFYYSLFKDEETEPQNVCVRAVGRAIQGLKWSAAKMVLLRILGFPQHQAVAWLYTQLLFKWKASVTWSQEVIWELVRQVLTGIHFGYGSSS